MDLELVYRKYRTEKERLLALAAVTVPKVCPRCESPRFRPNFSRRKGKQNRRAFTCVDCRKELSITKGTIFNWSQYPLGTWYEVIKLVNEKPELYDRPLAVSKILGLNYEFTTRAIQKIRKWLYTQEHEDKQGSQTQEDMRKV